MPLSTHCLTPTEHKPRPGTYSARLGCDAEAERQHVVTGHVLSQQRSGVLANFGQAHLNPRSLPTASGFGKWCSQAALDELRRQARLLSEPAHELRK